MIESIIEKDIETYHYLYKGYPVINTNGNPLYFGYGKDIFYCSNDSESCPDWKPFAISDNCIGEVFDVAISVGTKCNLTCDYCYLHGQKGSSFNVQLLSKMLKKYSSRYNRANILFFGGEPTLYWTEIRKMIHQVRDLFAESLIMIYTNGIEALWEEFVELKVIPLISFDGILNDVRFSRSNQTYENTIREIEYLSSFKVPFKVRVTVHEKNIDYLSENIQFLLSLGVSFIHIEPVSYDNAIQPYGYEKYTKALLNALDRIEKAKSYIISSPFMNLVSPKQFFCTSCWGINPIINSDGSISACYRVQTKTTNHNNHFLESFNFGHLNGNGELDLDDNKIKRMQSHLTIEENPICNSCFAKYICGGGCTYRNLFHKGNNTYGLDLWLCETKKILIDNAIIRLYESSIGKRFPSVLGEQKFEEEIMHWTGLENITHLKRSEACI